MFYINKIKAWIKNDMVDTIKGTGLLILMVIAFITWPIWLLPVAIAKSTYEFIKEGLDPNS